MRVFSYWFTPVASLYDIYSVTKLLLEGSMLRTPQHPKLLAQRHPRKNKTFHPSHGQERINLSMPSHSIWRINTNHSMVILQLFRHPYIIRNCPRSPEASTPIFTSVRTKSLGTRLRLALFTKFHSVMFWSQLTEMRPNCIMGSKMFELFSLLIFN
jgi:hypothetical protein